MGNTSTKERSMTPPHGGHHHLSSTALSSRRNGGGNNGGPSSSGRLSGTLLSSGGAGSSESYSSRGRSRHNLESSLFGLGLTSRETRERDREAEKEAREQRKIEREKERLKERERSLREESVDGGFLVTQGVYTGVEDFKDKIVRHLMIERRLAPFFKGLDDHEPDWTDAQLVAAVKGLPIPSPDAQIHTETKSRSPTSRSRSQSYTSEGSNRTVDGRPIEAVLYKNATECPICFLYYPPYLNKTRCCDQDICSECFVQIKRPDPHHPEHHEGDQPTASDENALTGTADQLISEPATCPFCVEPEFGVIYTPPPFRRGLMFANSQSQNQIPSPMNFGFADGSSSSLPGHCSGTPPSFPSSPITPTGKRRLALGVNNPEVVTTDRIRPDWSQKLATARSHAARRAAAATALHTAAYLMGPHNPPASSSSTSESDTPSPAQSGTGTPRDGHHGAGGLTSLTSFTERLTGSGNFRDGSTLGPSSAHRDSSLFNERRSRVIDLEEMMLMEAIRLSLAEEEERKRKVELEEQKKRLAAPSISTRNGSNISLASSSGSVEGKGKSVDRSLYPQASAAGASSSSAVTTNSRPQLTSGGSGSGSGASDTSSFRSLPGSDDEGMTSENAGSGTETMFNFRSLAEMIVEEEGGRVDVDGQGEFVGVSRDEEREGKEDAETAEHVEDVAHDLRANGKNVTERATEA
ncbi:uncharacterized protein H6S33_000088 [Morchella sextelata]|uniref:uncharacterized protein n=1 Tax=Morchella sextelata TaxID=1174677 RepID=UPI001D045628|nr:uncharacterized protein H6S33_000088 [Morchella sextelata]KAH0614452.1 hypothetical protein H6S33_000088 [Morchella sextelata]